MAEVGFNLDSLLAVHKDMARGYLFKFQVYNAPLGLWRDTHPYLVRTTTLPDSNLEEITVPWQGMSMKLAATQTYNDFTVTFNVDAKSVIRYDFVNWVNFIHDPTTNIHGNPGEYMADVEITHLNIERGENIKYKLHHAWPKSIGTASLDYSNRDTLQFDVTWSYQYHTII